jgi:hypothetical protein
LVVSDVLGVFPAQKHFLLILQPTLYDGAAQRLIYTDKDNQRLRLKGQTQTKIVCTSQAIVSDMGGPGWSSLNVGKMEALEAA